MDAKLNLNDITSQSIDIKLDFNLPDAGLGDPGWMSRVVCEVPGLEISKILQSKFCLKSVIGAILLAIKL